MEQQKWTRRRFLIVVKTYPNPSAKLAETVCTAAVDESGQFVRLFPIPFRTMSEAKRFSKWQWIEADVVKAADPRRESYRVDTSTIALVGKPMPPGKGWPARWTHVAGLLSPSMCRLDKTAPGPDSPSIALIKPVEWELLIEDLPPEEREWSTKQRGNLLQQQGTADLFGTVEPAHGLLEKFPVKISYRFRCADPACSGHTKLFEDWEVCQSWRDWKRRYGSRDILEQMLRKRYADEPREHDNLYLFVGTLASHQTTWVVIGHAQPLHLRKPPSQGVKA